LDLSVNIFARETKETKELNARFREKKLHRDDVREKESELLDQKKSVKQIG
jgi:ATP-binding cassette subfamily G (WHITE) protein 2 (SNQ2)